MTSRGNAILFCQLLHVIVAKLIIYRQKQTKHFIYPEGYIGDGVRSDGVFKSYGVFSRHDIAFLHTTTLNGSDLLLFAEVFELNILQTRMKRRKHMCENNVKKNLQIFCGIDWTEVAEYGVKFGGHEYSYEFSTSIQDWKSFA